MCKNTHTLSISLYLGKYHLIYNTIHCGGNSIRLWMTNKESEEERWRMTGMLGWGFSLEAAFFSMHVDPVRLKCNNRYVGPLHRRKDPCNSLWLPSIYHPCIDCRWKEYIALKSRCRNSADLISINFHLEFDIFFISEQHKLFKKDAGVANFSSHP